MQIFNYRRLIIIFIILFLFSSALFGVDFDFTGKWNVYTFSNWWVPTETVFRDIIKKINFDNPDEQWEFTSNNTYIAESLKDSNSFSGQWEVLNFHKDYDSNILFISTNEFFIITKQEESNTPFGRITFKKFIRYHQIRNADLVDMPISSFIGLPQPPEDLYYFTNSSVPDIALTNDSPGNSVINPTRDNSLIVSSSEIYDNTLSYTVPIIDAKNETVDPFLGEFYYHLNVYREKYDLVPLARDTRVEKIAEDYSAILAKNGFIDHYALSMFEFKQLCNNHGLNDVILREILVSYQDGRTPLKVLSYYQRSPPHNDALLEEKGEIMGAGYINRDGIIFFTAYIVFPK